MWVRRREVVVAGRETIPANIVGRVPAFSSSSNEGGYYTAADEGEMWRTLRLCASPLVCRWRQLSRQGGQEEAVVRDVGSSPGGGCGGEEAVPYGARGEKKTIFEAWGYIWSIHIVYVTACYTKKSPMRTIWRFL